MNNKMKKYGFYLFGLAIVGSVFLLFGHIDFLKHIDALLMDRFILNTGERTPSDDIVVLLIDDPSLKKLGNPLPRKYYVRLIRKLTAFGAKTIVFDLFFGDPSQHDPANDLALAHVTDSTGQVVHCFDLLEEEPEFEYDENDTGGEKYSLRLKNDVNLNYFQALSADFPDSLFLAAFQYAGHATAITDSLDKRIRRIPFFLEYNEHVFPALGLTALLHYLDVTPEAVKIEDSFWGLRLCVRTEFGALQIPVNENAQALLNFYGVRELFKPYYIADILELFDAFDNQGSQVSLPAFKDKIVLIGSAESSYDIHETPFSARFPGTGIHATLLSNILLGDSIVEAPAWFNTVLMILLVSVLTVFFYFNRTKSKPIRKFYFFAAGLFLIFNLLLYYFFFQQWHVWLKAVQINNTVIVCFFTLLFYEKVILLRALKEEVHRLEKEIIRSDTHLETLGEQIGFQAEQFRVAKYLETELKKIVNQDANVQADYLNELIPKLLVSQELINARLGQKIQSLEIEKTEIEKEKIRLEDERSNYVKKIKGEDIPVKAPLPEPPPLDKKEIANQLLSAYQFFQSQPIYPTPRVFGIVCSPATISKDGPGRQSPMGKIFDQIRQLREYDSTVLITGAHGTGKELVARAVHEQSRRAKRRLVTLNCAAIPENLLESELFGHVRGAFTNAISDRMGAFEYADGGSIFLDEIGDLKPDLQAKLLRVLQNSTFQKMGSNKMISVNVRVIAATNRDLKKCIENNEFREDLYYRLNVFEVHVPLLKDRLNDIPFLIQYFLTEFNARHQNQKEFSSEAIIAAMCYNWPGNVRMLEHVIENVWIMTADKKTIQLNDLPEEIQNAYRNIFESEEVPWWSQLEESVIYEKERLLAECKSAIQQDQIAEFLASDNLRINQIQYPHCYAYLRSFVDDFASLFPTGEREQLVREQIVNMQDSLFQWCREQKVAKLSGLYDKVEVLLGRGRRQVDNWRKLLNTQGS